MKKSFMPRGQKKWKKKSSGTENIYKIYAESFRGADHLRRIIEEAQTIVSEALAAGMRQTGSPAKAKVKERP